MSKRLAFICGCLLFLGGPILALSPNDARNKLVEILQPSLVAASPFRVDGLALGNQVRFGQQAYQRYQCGPSDEFPGFISCNEEHKTRGNEVTRSHSILQSQDGTAYYVNSYFDPAFFDPNDIQSEINRMSSEFAREARIIQMPQREGLPNAVMAIWGAIQLEPLSSDESLVVASGGGHPGILVSFLGDLERSAKAGVPVYRLAGGAGFLWVATFDQNGTGVLRYLTIDDSKIEPSRQAASNLENQAANSSPVNPSVQQQSQSDAQAQAKEDEYRADPEKEKRRAEDADQQQKEARQLLEAQNRRLATIIEVAIGIFVLLGGVAAAVFLRMKRQTAPQQSNELG
jgi:hypothetical protein